MVHNYLILTAPKYGAPDVFESTLPGDCYFEDGTPYPGGVGEAAPANARFVIRARNRFPLLVAVARAAAEYRAAGKALDFGGEVDAKRRLDAALAALGEADA